MKADESEIRRQVVEAAKSQVDNSDPSKYWLDTIGTRRGPKHWCGAFALWALHQAGLAISWRWVIGKGFLWRLERTKDPKPGDIAYFNLQQHHAVVIEVTADRVHLVNGNSRPKGVLKIPSMVVINERPRKDVTAFYSIAGLIPPFTPNNPPPDEVA